MPKLEDLHRYSALLIGNVNTETKISILKILEVWYPNKDELIDSKIGKSVYKCSKEPGQIGELASIIVNKWKQYVADVNMQHQKRTNEHDSNAFIKSKKVRISLQDYYRKKGSTNINDESNLDDTKDGGLSSNCGIGFLDCLNLKQDQVRHKKFKPVKVSDIHLATTKRDVVVKVDKSVSTSNCLDNCVVSDTQFDATSKYESIRRIWHPKSSIIKEKYFERDIKSPPSLLNQCQNVLMEYRTFIEEVYLTPRFLLLDILYKFTVEQLIVFESFNPHYIEDNDDIWKRNFIEKFPGWQRINNNESWRAAFIRMLNYNEIKFHNAKQKFGDKIKLLRKEEEQKQIKLLGCQNRTAVKPSPLVKQVMLQNRYKSSMGYGSVMQKVQRQAKKYFRHLPL